MAAYGIQNPSVPVTREDILAWDRHLGRTDLTAYGVLNIGPEIITSAQIAATIHAQYTLLALALHPDRVSAAHPNLIPQCTRMMQKLNEAHFTLRDPLRRRDYNISAGVDNTHGDATYGLPGSINAELLRGSYGRVLVALARVREFNLTLPKIVVVGLESAGKSSTLERLAMRSAFPRGEEFTTRMPICMKLRFRLHENLVVVRHLRIHLDGSRTLISEERVIEPAELPHGAAQDVVDNDTIAQMIQDAIREAHPNDQGTGVLVDQEIQIEIRAPNVPDLDLIDLPGVVAMPETVRAATINCTQRYLRDPNTLILLVIASSAGTIRGEAELARHIEAEAAINPASRIWERTILVLSKVDKHPQHLARRLIPRLDHLADIPANCVVPVINRTHDDGQSIRDALASERAWFEAWCHDHPGFAADDMGMAGLLRHLSSLVNSHITNHWVPNEVWQLEQQLLPIEQSIAGLGREASTMTAAELMDAVRAGVLTSIDAFARESHWLFAADVLTFHWLEQGGPASEMMQYASWLERFLDTQLAPTITGVAKDMILRAMSSQVLPDRLCRFKGLKVQLLARVDRSADVRNAISDVRALIHARGLMDIDQPRSLEHRQRVLKNLVLQHCLCKCLKPSSELLGSAQLKNVAHEDEHTVRKRERLRQRARLIRDAIDALRQVGAAAGAPGGV
jgi:GTP-binding protein EngB required for normal cell division